MANRMIINHLSREAGARRISISELARQSGLSYAATWALYNDKVDRVELRTLDRLCATLGCGVGDLFSYVPDPEPKP